MAQIKSGLSVAEKRFVGRVIVAIGTAYLCLLVLPWVALALPAVRFAKELQTVLQQLGTYGDMFGALNSLVTGLALIGIVYTSILQRRELDLQRKEIIREKRDRIKADRRQRRAALMDATTQLVRTYADEYAVNKQLHDNDHDYAVQVSTGKREAVPGVEYDPARTLKGKLVAARNVLEGMCMAEINIHGDFFLNLVESRKPST